MANELVPVTGNSAVQTMSLDEMKVTAELLITSGMLPKHFKTPQQIIAAMMFAQDIGLPPRVAVNVLYPLPNGTIGTDTKTMLALCYRSGLMESYTYDADKDGTVTVYVKRQGLDKPIHFSFGDQDARAAGLYNKQTYQAYRRTMYIWRATAGALRIAFPDVIFGLYDREEFPDSALVSTPRPVVPPEKIDPDIIEGEFDEKIDDWFQLFEIVQKRLGVSANAAFVFLKCDNVPEVMEKYGDPSNAYKALVEAMARDAENAKVNPILDVIRNVFGKTNDAVIDYVRNWVKETDDPVPAKFPLDEIEGMLE